MDLAAAIQQGNVSPLLLAATALMLGALHGLEPGHSKTMMAAFIIAVRGTVAQAVLLGVSAAFSHSLIVWGLALIALQFGDDLVGESTEPYFVMGSGVLIVLISLWMAARLLNIQARRRHDHACSPMDSHARAHALDVGQRFANGKTTTWQIIAFGLSGGLIPCSAAITVLILCLHLGEVSLGFGLVAAFSLGLAVTFVAVGVAVALGLRYASARTAKLDGLFQKAPYISVFIIGSVGIAMMYSGYSSLLAVD